MVAKITIAKKLISALNYNENKVKREKAECIHASGYLRDINNMNFDQKLEAFERLICLNERATTKAIHISLNFDPREYFPKHKLIAIAQQYMKEIGFGEQPYLVYQHWDAGHPHIHIVSTTIQEDGKRIPTHNIGRNQSEKARKEVEQEFHLIKAEQEPHPEQTAKPLQVKKIVYGKMETKKGITAIVNAVIDSYVYCSLAEYNAILKQFNVTTDRGDEHGRIYKNRGLVYRALDENGHKCGVPIKASDINSKPTIAALEKRFDMNQRLKHSLKNHLMCELDQALLLEPGSIYSLVKLLQNKNIYANTYSNADGRIYGITFVDNHTKAVFNESELGKKFSMSNLHSRIKENKCSSTEIPVTLPDNMKTKEQEQQFTKESIEAKLVVDKPFEDTPFEPLKKKRIKKGIRNIN